MHRSVSRPWARGLLGCAVCLVLLAQGTLGSTAVGPGGETIDPSISFDAGTVSFGTDKPGKDENHLDVVIFMQNIPFPKDPTPGALFDVGQNPGIWGGIRTVKNSNKMWFQVNAGSAVGSSFPSSGPAEGEILRTGFAAVVLTQNFPQDGEKHDVLIHVTAPTEIAPGVWQGSVRVFIDCEERGIGYVDLTTSKTNFWANADNGAYLSPLQGHGGNHAAFQTHEGKLPWSGGSVGAGPMHFYYDAGPKFSPFTPYYFGCSKSCNAAQTASCDANAVCAKNTSAVPEITCTCRTGFEGHGETCTDIDECTVNSEEISKKCDYMAECDNGPGSFACVCPVGFVGEGVDECFGDAWAVRTVFNVPASNPSRRTLTAEQLDAIKLEYARIISADPTLPMNSSEVSGMPVSFGAFRYGDNILEILEEDADGKLTLMALMLNQSDAEASVARLATLDASAWIAIGTVDDEPNVYRWVAQTTSAALEINPSGLQVDSVYFDPVCLSSGCWKVEITYTVGRDNINVIYLPKAEGDDGLSYDFDYTTDDVTWEISPADTFVPSEHPCGTLDYNPSPGSPLPASVTSCCIPQFLDMYRPVSTFEAALGAVTGLDAALSSACNPSASTTTPKRNRAVPRDQVPIIAQRGQTVDAANNVFPRPVAPGAAVPGLAADIFSDGVFSGMTESRINHTEVVDAYIGVYRAVLSLDEVELRRLGGQLRGTVGVEHTLDFFVGKLEFSMTGIQFLDPFATQAAIHVEKTNFFSVSTHGVNEYSFLEYVNMRLVTILWEDDNFAGDTTGTGMSGDANGDDESAERTVRTATTDNVNYVQVTFTLGSQYKVNNNPNADKYESGLIPLDSVRVGRGTFFDSSTMEHVCQEYELAEEDLVDDTSQMVGLAVGRVKKSDFDDAVAQPCGPSSSMCASPSSIPDQFVSFNIPLGKEIFDGQASNTLSNNIFVDFVVNALDPTATGTPNNGDAPGQMKTTLTASIPIVDGGVNIYCDGVTAKTDLKDVANADIVVGTASSAAELTRLRIIEDVASTDLAEASSTQIDTDSIESALMTLVLIGNASYFTPAGATNTGGYSLELDDVITIHLMEDGDAGTVANGVSTNSKETTLITLLNEPADDNTDSSTGLDTDGYKLNGAFRFDVARDLGIAKLEPTPELLAVCPFNPPRPMNNNGQLETCITRRDVRSREYPARTGSLFPTAMEIFNSEVMDDDSSKTVNTWTEAAEVAALGAQVVTPGSKPCPGTSNGDYNKATFADSGYACEAGFMTSILGDSEYSRQLAKDFVGAIRTRYALNGRYIRAFWINPGYEWTPTQTAGKSLFQVSQKIYLFALITLDENWSRRRMLLQADPTANSGSGTGGAKVEFPVTPTRLLAQSFEVPEDKVAAFEVELQLTPTEACMSTPELQNAIRLTMDDYLTRYASSFWTVQITRMNVDKGDEDCSSRRRGIRSLLSGFSSATATVQMLVVYKDGEEAMFNDKGFAEMAGVNSVKNRNTPAQVTIDPTYKCTGNGCGSASPSSPSASAAASSDNTALIAGIAGGAGGALLLGAAAVVWFKSRRSDDHVVAAPVQTINVEDLKTQLSSDA